MADFYLAALRPSSPGLDLFGSFMLFMSFSRLRECKKLAVTFLLPYSEQICLG